MSGERAENDEDGDLLDVVCDELEAARMERDEAMRERDEARKELAAAQAREARLRAWLRDKLADKLAPRVTLNPGARAAYEDVLLHVEADAAAEEGPR